MIPHPENLRKLYHDHFGRWPATFEAIRSSGGSDRRYYRMTSTAGNAIGAWNPVREENRAFLYFSRHFKSAGLHVPDVYREDQEHDAYLLEDLGDNALLALVDHSRNTGTFPDAVREYYRLALKELPLFQLTAGNTLDYSYCYPREDFDRRSMLWDLNYFKYYFLKLHVPFHEEKLEEDFEALTGFLLKSGPNGFLYRDFQARNILIRDGQPYFIDYQGGRKGPLQYDVASLLFQAKAGLPPAFREEMLEYYLGELRNHIDLDAKEFRTYYDGFTLLRILQVLGAYGFRGLIEKKPHFRLSIPGALENLRWWLANVSLPVRIPELITCLHSLAGLETYKSPAAGPEGRLTVAISSFSYKNGIPDDHSGHGGGFVFDCRALPNPGREERYRSFTGRDEIIINYLGNDPEVISFLDNVQKLVVQSVDNYLERNFERISVQFGCTGGQHRSVYCAEKTASFLKEKYPQVKVTVSHPMLNLI